MDNEDILSLINNITSKNRLDKLVHVISELIMMNKNINYKTVINKKICNIFNLIDYYQTELNCNNVSVLNNLSYKYINQYKYDHKIQKTKSEHDTLREYNRTHYIYRVNALAYNQLRRNHRSILALIY